MKPPVLQKIWKVQLRPWCFFLNNA